MTVSFGAGQTAGPWVAGVLAPVTAGGIRDHPTAMLDRTALPRPAGCGDANAI